MKLKYYVIVVLQLTFFTVLINQILSIMKFNVLTASKYADSKCYLPILKCQTTLFEMHHGFIAILWVDYFRI